MNDNGLEQVVVGLAEQARSRFYGKYRGVVERTDDPDSLGRIRAYVPEVLDTELSPWALPCAAYAGPNVGLYAIPPRGAGVFIEFEAGDPARPIWCGGWWGRDDPPKNERNASPGPPQKTLRTETGLMLALDDDAHTATLSDTDGSNLVTIKVDNGEIRIVAASKVVVEAPQIELVDGAPHPLVFGDNLRTYLNQLVQIFNSHLHVGQTAGSIPVAPMKPAVPFPQAQPSLLSQKVKTG